MNGDGALEHLEKTSETVYDYPEGALPWQLGDPWPSYTDRQGGEYFLRMTAEELATRFPNVRIIDGVYYYLFTMKLVGVTEDGSYCETDDPMCVGTKIIYEGDRMAMAVPLSRRARAGHQGRAGLSVPHNLARRC